MTPAKPSADNSAAAWEAAQTVHRLFLALDDGRVDDVGALFALDGVWVRQGETLAGPQGVCAGLASRPRDLSTRHLVTNMVVDATPDGLQARYYVLVFDHIGEIQGPAPLSMPAAIFVCQDRLVPTPQGWRFAHRAPRPAFIRKKQP